MQPQEPETTWPPALGAIGSWQTTLVVGFATLILGLIVSFHPSGSLNVIAVLIGLLVVISGMFDLVRMFGSGESHRVWMGISGLLLIVLGVILIRHLDLTVAIIGLIIGIAWIIQGLSALAVGFGETEGRARLVDILWDRQPARRNHHRGDPGEIGHRACGPGRDLVHRPGPVRDPRRFPAPAHDQEVADHHRRNRPGLVRG